MEQVTKEIMLKVVDLFDALSITWWLDGGWGVDVLFGRQTREHRDIDINFDAAFTEKVLERLKAVGYAMDTDWFPIRAALFSPEFGYLDIHPFVIDGETIKQANPEGGFWEFPAGYFGEAVFEDRRIPCMSLEGQKAFHSGYEPREQDIHDLTVLKELEGKAL